MFVQKSLGGLYSLDAGGCGSIYGGKLAEQGSETQIAAKTVLVRTQGYPERSHLS